MGIGIILDIIIIGILVLSIWLGYKKGLTKSLLRIFSFLIAIIISLILFRPISNFVIANTNIVNNLQSTISNTFKHEEEKNNKNESQKIEEDKSEEKKNSENGELEKKENKNTEKDFTNIFNKYIEKKIIEAGNEAKDYAIDLASKEIAIFIVNISIYIILFIVIRIALIFIKALAEVVTKIPGIKQCDELCGGIYGGIRACIILLIVFTILSIILSVFQLDGVLDILNQSIISKFIYENNIIIKIIL